MKMVKLKGRLGNQMFIYAFAKALAYNTGEKIYFDKENYDNSLENMFNVEMNFADRKYSEKLIEKFIKKLPKKLRKCTEATKINPICTEPRENSYCPELFDIKGSAYYEGYYQCEKYFANIEDELRHDFTFKPIQDKKLNEQRDKIKSATNPVFINIRRGDYVTLEEQNIVHWLCSMSYYQKATKYIIEKIPDATFFAISDEPEWTRENFKIDYPFEVVSANLAMYDIYLLSACKHGIVANSSYSWWGAWLIDNPDKIICAPSPWLEPERTVDTICDNWITFSRVD